MTKSLNSLPSIEVFVPPSLVSLFLSKSLDSKCLHLVSRLTQHVLKYEGSKRSFHYRPMSSAYLIETMSSSYRASVNLLIEKGIVEISPSSNGREHYSVEGGKAKEYRLTRMYSEEVKKGGAKSIQLSDHRQLKRVYKWWARSKEKLFEEHDWLESEIDAIGRLNFNEEAASRCVRQIYKEGYFREEPLTGFKFTSLQQNLQRLIQLFKTKCVPGISVKHGRVFHPIVYAQREFRDFITTKDGEPLVEIDMKSAQWVFLCKALAIKEKYQINDSLVKTISKYVDEAIDILSYLPEYYDAHAFARTVFFQDIYTELGLLRDGPSYAITSGAMHKNREEIKRNAIAKGLYDYFRDPQKDLILDERQGESNIRALLREHYPSVYAFLLQCAEESGIKSRSSDLAKLLQSMEGHFFHQVLQRALNKRFPDLGYYIVHDAFYVPQKHSDEVKELFKACSEKMFGVPVKWG
jgi:hypothetical protein